MDVGRERGEMQRGEERRRGRGEGEWEHKSVCRGKSEWDRQL